MSQQKCTVKYYRFRAISAPEHRILNFLVSNPHNQEAIMEGRHKNFEDSMTNILHFCSRSTLRSAPYRHKQKNLTQNHLQTSPLRPQKSYSKFRSHRTPLCPVSEFLFFDWNHNIFVNQESKQNFKTTISCRKVREEEEERERKIVDTLFRLQRPRAVPTFRSDQNV